MYQRLQNWKFVVYILILGAKQEARGNAVSDEFILSGSSFFFRGRGWWMPRPHSFCTQLVIITHWSLWFIVEIMHFIVPGLARWEHAGRGVALIYLGFIRPKDVFPILISLLFVIFSKVKSCWSSSSQIVFCPVHICSVLHTVWTDKVISLSPECPYAECEALARMFFRMSLVSI